MLWFALGIGIGACLAGFVGMFVLGMSAGAGMSR